jgi:integrase
MGRPKCRPSSPCCHAARRGDRPRTTRRSARSCSSIAKSSGWSCPGWPTCSGRHTPPLPTVLTPEETSRLFDAMEGTPRMVARLLYGTGMRLLEACASARRTWTSTGT